MENFFDKGIDREVLSKAGVDAVDNGKILRIYFWDVSGVITRHDLELYW